MAHFTAVVITQTVNTHILHTDNYAVIPFRHADHYS